MKVTESENEPRTSASQTMVVCAVFCCVLSTVMSLLHLFARSGLGAHTYVVFINVVTAFAVILAPIVLARIAGSLGHWKTYLPLAITGVFLFPITECFLQETVAVPLALVAAIGLMLIVRELRFDRSTRCVLIIGGPATALLYFIWLNGSAFGHLYQYEFAQLGRLYLDNVFHSAIAEMIRNFDIASTGADGLVPVSYHVGSHAWIAAFANAVGEPAMIVYPAALQIVAIPCFLYAFFLAAGAVNGYLDVQPSRYLLVVILFLVGSSWLIWDKLLLSESYVFSLVPFMSGLPLLFSILLRPKGGILEDKQRLMIAVALFPLILWLKIAVGVIWLLAVGYVVARSYVVGRLRFGLPLVICCVVLGFILLLFLAAQYAPALLRIRPFDFLRLYPIHFLADSAIVLAAIAVLAFRAKQASHDRKLQIELLIVLAVGGNIPGGIFALDNAAYYFINAATWVALVVLVGGVATQVGSVVHHYSRFDLYLAVAILALVIFDPARWKSGFLLVDRVAALHDFAEKDIAPASPYEKRSLGQAAREFGKQLNGFVKAAQTGVWFASNVREAVDSSLIGQVVKQVDQAKAISSSPFLVSVRPSDTEFWKMNSDCRAQPMLLPALTGVPMLMGLPQEEIGCDLGYQYGYSKYTVDSITQDLSDSDLCARATKRGFRMILIVQEQENQQIGTLVGCP